MLQSMQEHTVTMVASYHRYSLPIFHIAHSKYTVGLFATPLNTPSAISSLVRSSSGHYATVSGGLPVLIMTF